MSASNDQAEALVEAALDLPPEQRKAYLDRACGNDAQLRQLAEALLRAHEQFLATQHAAEPTLPPPRRPVAPADSGERAGDRIGHYKLLQQIGEGGCGVVYMAEQEEPVRRRVALKVIKLGMDTKEVIARFEAERQALALMDHPNIAKVLDAGATGAGRPYFVMELVRGIKITDYCDQHNLATADRLDLFIQVCRAVQHAHQKGIIHRDIKPSNILVTLNDGVPTPKVIDFGIAKATQGRLTDQTLFTAFEQFIGTPAYMSPEQAEMSALDIDTRSDIYSLGVLLYELLTGKTPFDAKRLLKAGLDEIRRIIREEDPPRPSTRLSTLDGVEQTTVAKCRKSEPPRLIHLVQGDLDWIVMKALEKDRTRRYETANGLAVDVQRYLANEAVAARPPSKLYRFQKLLRRNKLIFAASGAVLAALVSGITFSAWALVREHKDRREAERQRGLAEQLRTEAEEQAGQIRRQLYASEMNVGLEAWKEGDLAGALAALERYQSQPGQDDLRAFEWFYLWRLCHSEQLALSGHRTKVRAVAFSPDGQRLVSGGDDTKARVWDVATGRQIAALEGHRSLVSAVAFSPDGKVIATGSQDLTVRLWDADTFRELVALRGLENGVGAISFSPDGRWLAASSARLVSGPGNPSTRFIDATPFGAEVKVWRVADQSEVATLSGHRAGIHSLAFSPDAKVLASASAAGEVLLWNLPEGTQHAPLASFPVPVLAVAFSRDGKRLAVGGGDPYGREALLKVLDSANGLELAELKGHRGAVFALAFSPDTRMLATAGMDQTVKFWDFARGSETHTLCGHASAIWSIAFDPTGRRLATASWDGTVKVWDATQRQDSRRFPGCGGYCVRFSPDGKSLACGGHGVQILKVGSNERALPLPDYHNGDTLVAWSPDGTRLAAAGIDGVVTVWETNQWRTLAVLKGDHAKIWSLVFSPDGSTLASGGDIENPTIRLWNVAGNREVFAVRAHTSSVAALAFTPDGRGLVGGSWNEIVCVDPQTGKEKWRMEEAGPRVVISPDGKHMAATAKGRPQSLRFIDLETREEKWRIAAHTDIIYGLAFCPDGKTLATASWDGTAKLWNAASGQEIFRYPTPGVAWSVAFSPDAAYWAIGSGRGEGEVALLHGATPEEAASNVTTLTGKKTAPAR